MFNLAYMQFTAKRSYIFCYCITGKQTIKYSVLHVATSLFSQSNWRFQVKSPIACNPRLACNPCRRNHFSECMSCAVFLFPSLLAPALCTVHFSMSVKMGLVAPPTWLPRCMLPEPWFPISAHSISSTDSRPHLLDEFGLRCPACWYVTRPVSHIWPFQMPASILQTVTTSFCVHTCLMLFLFVSKTLSYSIITQPSVEYS